MKRVTTLHNYILQIIFSLKTNNVRKTILLSVAFMAFLAPCFSATTYLVQLGSGTQNSATWRAAGSGEVLVDLTTNVQSLTAWLTSKTFASGDQVWIATGTYPVSTGYTYPANLSIYGGFAGTETATSQRAKGNDAWSFTNATIIDGGTTTTATVFTGTATRLGFLIDGLTITRCPVFPVYQRDGVTIQNCQFTSNTGQGAVSYFGVALSNSSASITGCYFYNNTYSAINGGTIMSNGNNSSTMTISFCLFESNTTNSGGAAIRMQNGIANTVKNCIFKNNIGSSSAAAVYLNGANCTLTNCLIYGSTGSRAIYLGGGTISNCTVVNNIVGGVNFAATTAGSNIYNSVFWGTDANSGAITSVASNANGVVKNCAYTSIAATLTGGAPMLANNVVLPFTNTTGTNAPYFVDPATNNWKLSTSSSLKTIGSNTYSTANTASDLIGTSRGSSYDIGAYQYAASYLPVITFTDNLSSLTYGGSPVTLTGTSTSTTSNAGAPVTYTSGNTGYVTVSGKILTIAGAGVTTVAAHQAANSFYDAATNVSQSLTVAPKALTLNSPAATNKVYTGTNTAVITGSLDGIINSDDVTLSGTGTFASVNVANGIAVTSTSTLVGTKAGNYTLTQPTGLTANITAASSSHSGGNITAAGLTDAQLANTDLTVSSGELAINASKSIRSITVNGGAKLSVATGQTLTLNNLTLKSDNVNGTSTFVNDGTLTVSGTTNVEQYLATTRNWYVSSPVTNANAPAGFTFFSRNEAVPGWTAVNTGDGLVAGVGYIALPTAAGPITFTTQTGGSLNNGNITVPLTWQGASAKGFNLIGNPYPSHLTWNKTFTDANAAKIEPTIWYRTNSGGSNTGGWAFKTFNAYSGVGTPVGTTGIIPPMQAFWVLAKQDGNIEFTNAMRSHQTSNPLKSPAAKTSELKLIRLNVSNGTATDETVLLFNPNASNSYDNYDSPKIMNNADDIADIFTVTDTLKLAINGRSEVTYNEEIPIGFSTTKANNFSISANEITNFEIGTAVILKDKLFPNAVIELSQGTVYQFSSPVTTPTIDRFSLTLRAPGIATSMDKNEKNSVQVYVNTANQITINASAICNYIIYNAMGQQVGNGKTNSTRTVVNNPLKSGMYVVKVSENGSDSISRVIIR